MFFPINWFDHPGMTGRNFLDAKDKFLVVLVKGLREQAVVDLQYVEFSVGGADG